LAHGIDFNPARLKFLKIELENLSDLERFPGVYRFLFEEGLYSLTVENLEFVFRAILGIEDLEPLRTQHFTTVTGISNLALRSRVERGFVQYLKDVLLRLENNSRESLASIISIIAREDTDLDDLSVFLERQLATIPTLNDVPARLYALVFQLNKIEPSWANCVAFQTSDVFDAAILTGFLETEPALALLPQQAIPDDDKATALRQFLIGNDGLQDVAYRTYVRMLPKKFKDFPTDLGPSKLLILIEEAKVHFTTDSLYSLQKHIDLQVKFASRNIEIYLSNEANFAINDDFREMLLTSEIDDTQKLAIIRSMNLTLLPDMPSRAGKVGAVLGRTGADLSNLGVEAARAVILNSTPIDIQVSLLNKCQNVLSDGDVRSILSALPEPFSEITFGYHYPRIDNTDINTELVKWLDKRNIISSWSKFYFGDEIRINLYRRENVI
jgi:hypothetical protein